jgi:glycosyltransferase 2 family protein
VVSKRTLLVIRIAISAVVVASIAWALAGQWHQFREHPLDAHPEWSYVLLSGAVFMATYVVLIQTWRMMLGQWNARLSFWAAARIWAVTNLYKYVPGKLWQIGAMGVMAQREGVSSTAAAGSAILNTVVAIATGTAIALGTGWAAVERVQPGTGRVMLAGTALAVVGLALLPWIVPRLVEWLARITGRDLPPVTVPPSVMMYAVVGNVLSWLMYGIAFHFLVHGVLGQPAGAVMDHVAVYSASYVIGYAALVLPAGVGARDGAMAALLPAIGALPMPVSDAWLVVVASRVWLTILELVPGLLFLLSDGLRRRPSRQTDANASSR